MNLGEYEELIRNTVSRIILTDDPDQVAIDTDFLGRECVERMRVNVGLITENVELKRKLRLYEEGKDELATSPN